MTALRCFTYVRKSSESEERQELSIPAQLRELEALVVRQGLHVVGRPIEEARSAKSPGRPAFSQMIQDIGAGKADGIVCWRLDRLARNPLDGGTIMWSLGQGEIKQIVTPGRTYTGTGDDKMLMAIEFGMATKYSDDLSVNVRRGNREALEQGRWPGYPKIGYVRDQATMRLVPDPERFERLREMWRLLLSGASPLDILQRAAVEWGFTTPRYRRQGGGPMSRAALYRFFRDEFYTGVMIRAGERFPGTHPPMVTTDEFALAQDILDGRVQRMPRAKTLFFPYRGLIRCGCCGAMATARNLTKPSGRRYTYYHCYRKERRYKYCPEPAVQEVYVEQALQAFFDDLVLPPRWLRALDSSLQRLVAESSKTAGDRRLSLQRRIAEIAGRLERLRRLCVDEVITPDDYQHDKMALEQERQTAEDELGNVEDPTKYLEPWHDAVKLAQQAPFYFADGKPEEKRALAQRVTWNLLLSDGKPLIQAKKEYEILASWRQCPTVRAWRDYVETTLSRSLLTPILDSRRTTANALVGSA